MIDYDFDYDININYDPDSDLEYAAKIEEEATRYLDENYPLLIGFDHYDSSSKYAVTLDGYLLSLVRGFINTSLKTDLDKHVMELLEDEWFHRWPLVHWAYASRLLYGIGCRKNVKRAVSILLPMAEKECPGAMYDIGYCYMNGLGLEKSYTKAIYYWIKASAAGFISAKQDLKTTYFYGNREDYKGLPPELRLYFVYEVINIYMEEKGATEDNLATKLSKKELGILKKLCSETTRIEKEISKRSRLREIHRFFWGDDDNPYKIKI